MKIILAGGGTAGHINPALSIAKMLKKMMPHAQILFIGNRNSLEDRLVNKAGFDIEYIKVNSIKRKLTLDNVKTAVNFLKSVSACKKIIKDFRADAVIGTGGYVSGPVVYAAAKLGVKCFIHEQNAFPGVTSKFLSKFAETTFISFEGSEKHFPKAKNIVFSGNPIDERFMSEEKSAAREKLGIGENDFYVLSFAGSLGARRMNEMFADFIVKNDKNKDFVHTHACGKAGFTWMPRLLADKGFDINKKSDIEVLEYIYDMPTRLVACDLAVSRAGAIALGEITATGSASLLIPSPNVTANHQYHNAMALANKDAAFVLEEKDATAEKIYDIALKLKNDPEKLRKMGENARKTASLCASEIICNEIYKILKNK